MVPFTSAILFAIRARRLLLPLPVAASIARCLLAILLRSTDTSMSLFLSREPIFAHLSLLKMVLSIVASASLSSVLQPAQAPLLWQHTFCLSDCRGQRRSLP